jgi:hypothetical protein
MDDQVYYVGDETLSFYFIAFTILDTSFTITYSALLSNGNNLPNFIIFSSNLL